MREMTTDAPTNAWKYVTSNIACACAAWGKTRNIQSSDWPKWCCALWRLSISRFFIEPTFQTVWQTGFQYVNSVLSHSTIMWMDSW